MASDSFVGQHVNHAAAHHDGVANGERLQRRGQQHAAVHFGLNIEIVGDHHVVDDGLQNLVDLAFGSEQANLLQAIDHVDFGLTFPGTLRFDGRGILRLLALVLHGLGRVHR